MSIRMRRSIARVCVPMALVVGYNGAFALIDRKQIPKVCVRLSGDLETSFAAESSASTPFVLCSVRTIVALPPEAEHSRRLFGLRVVHHRAKRAPAGGVCLG